jgi:L-alanine-DL-glutamate epimerase-like enolase superfamily enzyme
VRLRIELIEARLRAPFVSATGAVTSREILLVSLAANDDLVGYGEAAPLESYDRVSIADCRAALEDCRPVLQGADDGDGDREGLLAACKDAAVLPQAIAAIDLALWDLAGRRAKRPVWQLLGGPPGPPPPSVPVNATIASADRAGAAAEAAAAWEDGFGCVKVKVGIGDDAGRVAAVRAAAGPAMAIRLDANGVWPVDEALAALRVLEPAGIELCEEPASGIEAIAEVAAATNVPIALDESARLPGAFDRRHADAVCLKIAGCGGISGVIDAAARARAAGYEVYLASTLDGPLGIAAALHAAAVARPDRPSGLATLDLFEGRDNSLPVSGGRIAAPAGPGLGVDPGPWYSGR